VPGVPHVRKFINTHDLDLVFKGDGILAWDTTCTIHQLDWYVMCKVRRTAPDNGMSREDLTAAVAAINFEPKLLSKFIVLVYYSAGRLGKLRKSLVRGWWGQLVTAPRRSRKKKVPGDARARW
jgi:hypothetical protein